MELNIVFIDFIIGFMDFTFAFVAFDTILGGYGDLFEERKGAVSKNSLKTTDVDKFIRYEEMKVK